MGCDAVQCLVACCLSTLTHYPHPPLCTLLGAGDVVRPFYLDNPTAPSFASLAANDAAKEGPDAQGEKAAGVESSGDGIPARLEKQRRINWFGLLVFLIFMAAFGFYIYVRVTYTLGLGALLW